MLAGLKANKDRSLALVYERDLPSFLLKDDSLRERSVLAFATFLFRRKVRRTNLCGHMVISWGWRRWGMSIMVACAWRLSKLLNIFNLSAI